jgi:hypothetical protein
MTAALKQVAPPLDPATQLQTPTPPARDVENVIREVEAIQGQMQGIAVQKGVTAEKPASGVAMVPSGAKAPTSGVLLMSVQGSMAVQLNFGQKGESMTLEFNEATVTLKLSNGMELSIPRSKS